MKMKREAFHSEVRPAPDALERLERDLKRVGQLPEPLFLCFSCDPYYAGANHFITRVAIEIIQRSGNTVNILTKGGKRACRDFNLLTEMPGSKVGATLTFYDFVKSTEWEPNAALPVERLYMLEFAKELGIETWASIEPVIDPEQSLLIMEAALPFVDTFKIGKLNYHPLAATIDWKAFAQDAVYLMKKNAKKYMIKEDLKKYL